NLNKVMDNNFWNNRYTQVNDLYGTEPNQYFREKIGLLKSGHLIIPGEGEGRQAIYAAAKGSPGGRPNIHKRIAASVKPEGHLIIEAFHPMQLAYASGGPKSEDMLYTAEMLSQDFIGCEFIEKLEGEVLLREGSGHAGPAYVTRIFARKED